MGFGLGAADACEILGVLEGRGLVSMFGCWAEDWLVVFDVTVLLSEVDDCDCSLLLLVGRKDFIAFEVDVWFLGFDDVPCESGVASLPARWRRGSSAFAAGMLDHHGGWQASTRCWCMCDGRKEVGAGVDV